jgi:phosphatidylglycerophosphatase C
MRVIACFDFDGTLTRSDTLGPFLRGVAGNGAFLRALAGDAPRLALAGAGAASRDDAKERMLGRLLGGRAHADLVTHGHAYADQVVARRMRRDMVDRVRWHVARGHEIAIVSASLDVYVDRVADLLGVESVLCSRLEVDDDGRVTGRLVGGNCRGLAKAARIREQFGADGYELWAYGDSAGDTEMLAAADHPVRVTRRGRVRIPTP